MDSVPANSMGNSSTVAGTGPIDQPENPFFGKPLKRKLPHVLPMSKKVRGGKPLSEILRKNNLNTTLKKEIKRDERAGV